MGVNVSRNKILIFKNFYVKRDCDLYAVYLKFGQGPAHPFNGHIAIITPNDKLANQGIIKR
jgi:hypothetical protein